MNKKDIDLETIKIMTKELSSLHQEIAFLGGSTISLFITEPDRVKIRETLDVDCVVEVGHRQDYEKIAQKLRKIGFSKDIESRVICRFKKGDLTLDVMPTDPQILGFTNIWYKEGFEKAIELKVVGPKY